MHTASFGRENSLYVRAAMENKEIHKMALLQDADIILHNNGLPSVQEKIGATRTMRAEAMSKGIPTITVEYGNPQVYQPKIIRRGVRGVQNILSWLDMTKAKTQEVDEAIQCKRSYWIYMYEGGYLELTVDLKQIVNKGDLIAKVRNPFGKIIKQYFSPENGIVIGRSSNPINMTGGRILHLGIIDE